MQKLLIHRSNLPHFLSLFVTLFFNVLRQAFIVEPLVGEVALTCVGGDMVTFSSLRTKISLSCLHKNQTFPCLIAVLVYTLPYVISVLEL